MRPPSGLRIALAAVAACLILALSLAFRHGAKGATPDAIAAVPSDNVAAASEEPSTAPPGFVNFEMRYPDEVRESAPATVSTSQLARVRYVNDTVNDDITWQTTHLWTIAPDGPAYGDCKTYALTKRHDLRLAGVPDGALRLVIVHAALYKTLHMLLEIRSTAGVYVLDSLPAANGATFYRASEMPTSYTIIKYEAWGRPAHWVQPAFPASAYQSADEGP